MMCVMQAKSNLPQEDREKVAEAMCHSVRTSDKFYVAMPSPAHSVNVRSLVIKACKLNLQETEGKSQTESRDDKQCRVSRGKSQEDQKNSDKDNEDQGESSEVLTQQSCPSKEFIESGKEDDVTEKGEDPIYDAPENVDGRWLLRCC